MKIPFLLLFLSIFLSGFGQSISLEPNGALTIFPIAPKSRVADIISMFQVLSNPANPVFAGNRPPEFAQIGLQTTRNGLLINVISLAPATSTSDATILLVSYNPNSTSKKNIPPNMLQYAAIPVEQVVGLIFSNNIIPQNSMFQSHAFTGTLPIFSVDMAQRAKDIQGALAFFNSIQNASSSSSVSLMTAMSGPFYSASVTPPVANGMIPYIVSIDLTEAPNGTLMLVTYLDKPPLKVGATGSNRSNLYYIVVSPDQVYGIMYNPG